MIIAEFEKGATNKSVVVRVVDSDGHTPEIGVSFATAGASFWYRRDGSVKIPVALVDTFKGDLDDAHVDGGFLHIGDGYCRFDLPDAAVADGVDFVDVGGTFTGMIVQGGRVQLASGGVAVRPARPLPAGRVWRMTTSEGRVSSVDVVHVQPASVLDLAFDLGAVLRKSGEFLVENANLVISLEEGPADLTFGPASISGDQIQFRVSGQLDAQTYRLAFSAQTDLGQTLVGDGELECRAKDG